MSAIQLLKDNEKAFCKMSAEMQKVAQRIGPDEFQRLTVHPGKWVGNQSEFCPGYTYRLRPVYEEEPAIEECKIYPAKYGGFYVSVYNFGNTKEVVLARIPVGYQRIGFKFEDGMVRTVPIWYGGTFSNHYSEIAILTLNEYTVLHATHVLFRKGE